MFVVHNYAFKVRCNVGAHALKMPDRGVCRFMCRLLLVFQGRTWARRRGTAQVDSHHHIFHISFSHPFESPLWCVEEGLSSAAVTPHTSLDVCARLRMNFFFFFPRTSHAESEARRPALFFIGWGSETILRKSNQKNVSSCSFVFRSSFAALSRCQ